MTDQDIRRYERAQRVETFLTDNIAAFPPGSKVHALRTLMGGITFSLDQAKVGQVRTPFTISEIVAGLFADFKDIARTARSLVLENPDFPEEDYRVPASRTVNAATTHADLLLGLLEDTPGDSPEILAEKAARRADFISEEMDPDFVADLRALRNSVDTAHEGKFSDNHEGLESTEAIGLLLNRANDTVTRLTSLVHNLFRNQPEKIHAWKQASRIERAPKKQTPPPEPIPVPEP